MAPPLSEWLQIMLAEIARKQEEARRAAEEDERRKLDAQQPMSVPKYLSIQA